MSFEAYCSMCEQKRSFPDGLDYWGNRNSLISPACPRNGCVTRERAAAAVVTDVAGPRWWAGRVHEIAPSERGLSLWLRQKCRSLTRSGYFPEAPFGTMVGDLRNEDMEKQTFADGAFGMVIHLDVMEHLFNPFAALRETYRTLSPGGLCIFTAPTEAGRKKSEQVAFLESGGVRIVGKPEYHGNPQSDKGSLVTWRYGYDLPDLIEQQTGFSVEVRRWSSPAIAVRGPMTEVYILRKP